MTSAKRGEATVPVEFVERAAAQNLQDYVGAMQKVAPDTHTAAVSCAGGVAAFTGVDSPLTTVKGAGPEISETDIDTTIAFFKSHGASSVTFELARSITAETKARLARRGFEAVETEDVVACRLPRDGPTAAHSVEQMAADVWARLLIAASELSDLPASHTLIQAAAFLPDAVNLGVRDQNLGWIACAQMAPTAGLAIFGCDGTLPEARGRGAQTSLIRERLRLAGTRGFPWAIAEVAPGSISERNYLRCGFRVIYPRTYYRLHPLS